MASEVTLKSLDYLLTVFRVDGAVSNSSRCLRAKSEVLNAAHMQDPIERLVMTFTKRVQATLYHHIIPTEIMRIIVRYYGMHEFFDIAGLTIGISADYLTMKKFKVRLQNNLKRKAGRKTIPYTNRYINAKCQSVYGSKLIVANNRNKSIYSWSFRINHGGSGVFVIGVACGEPLKFANKPFFLMPVHYGFNIYNGRKVTNGVFTDYGDCCGTHDVVQMQLDLQERTIIYFVNGVSQGTAFENVETGKHIHYKLAITLQEPNDGCTLLQFHTH